MNKLIGVLALLFLVGGAGSSAHADGPLVRLLRRLDLELRLLQLRAVL